MHRMAQHLRYFIAKRVAEESSWQGIQIIFSGPDVPGEGEHKIMEYVRCAKAQPGYDANLRHCLYGLDADLILLGLLSHDPHFALLREEVLFGPASRKPRTLAQTRFFLMHLGLLRDYFDAEFRSSYASERGAVRAAIDFDAPPFPHYSVERLLDDFILMTVFVGNDFLPGLPYLHIGEGALGIMFDAYKKVFKASGGRFMNNAGTIDYGQMAAFLQELSHVERSQFERTGAHLSETAKRPKAITGRQMTLYKRIKTELLLATGADSWAQTELERPLSSKDKAFVWRMASDFGLLFHLDDDRRVTLTKGWNNEDVPEDSPSKWLLDHALLASYEGKMAAGEESEGEGDGEDEEGAGSDRAFTEWKASFYKEKLHLDTVGEPACLKPLVEAYLRGLQWNMYYYYRGVVDWAWYFPYHYGPYLTDVASAAATFVCDPFVLGRPYAPLEQLLAVLPAASSAHVPRPFAELMSDAYSPILDFYPKDFSTDANGKKTPWEAVVLIPFIDEERLLAAVEGVSDELTADERERNQFGSSTLTVYEAGARRELGAPPGSRYGPLTLPVQVLQYDLPVLDTGYAFKPELLPGVKPLAGFPSLRSIRHAARLEMVGVALFDGVKPTTSPSLLLTPSTDAGVLARKGASIELVARELAGQRMYAAWPFLLEGLVVRITDGLFSYDQSGKRALTEKECGEHTRTLARVADEHRRKMAVELPLAGEEEDSEVLVWLAGLQGLCREADGATRKVYAAPEAAEPYPARLVLPPSVCLEDARWVERAAMKPEEEYPVGSSAIYVGSEAPFGSLCRVTGHTPDGHVAVEIERRLPLAPEPSFPARLANAALATEAYYPARQVAHGLGVSPVFLAKITSAWYLFHGPAMDKASNIGLGLKFDGRGQRAAGYARRVQGTWEFSQRAVDLIRAYKATFPQLFAALLGASGAQQTQAAAVFPGRPEADTPAGLAKLLEPVRAWIRAGTERLRIVPIDTALLPEEGVQQIHVAWNEYAAAHPQTKVIQLPAVPTSALRHEGMAEFIAPNDAPRFHLGDRVRYLGSGSGGIPFGVPGIVVGLEDGPPVAHVLLDEPLIGVAKSLGGLCPAHHGVSIPRHLLLNLNQPGPKHGSVEKQLAGLSLGPGMTHVTQPSMPPTLSALFSAAAAKAAASAQTANSVPAYAEVAPSVSYNQVPPPAELYQQRLTKPKKTGPPKQKPAAQPAKAAAAQPHTITILSSKAKANGVQAKPVVIEQVKEELKPVKVEQKPDTVAQMHSKAELKPAPLASIPPKPILPPSAPKQPTMFYTTTAKKGLLKPDLSRI